MAELVFNKLVVSLIVVIFIKVAMLWSSLFLSPLLLCISAIRIILLRMGLLLQRRSFPHQLLFKKVVLNNCDVIYFPE